MADLTDRNYALFANNQHPIQLNAYEEYNRFLRNVHSQEYNAGLNDIDNRMTEIIDHRASLLNQAEGESLSIDDLSDIYIQAMAEHRGKNNISLNTRSKNGDINDYLEVRRPFGAAQ